MQSPPSVCPSVSPLTFEPSDLWPWPLACVWVMTVAVLALKVRSKVKVKDHNAVNGTPSKVNYNCWFSQCVCVCTMQLTRVTDLWWSQAGDVKLMSLMIRTYHVLIWLCLRTKTSHTKQTSTDIKYDTEINCIFGVTVCLIRSNTVFQ